MTRTVIVLDDPRARAEALLTERRTLGADPARPLGGESVAWIRRRALESGLEAETVEAMLAPLLTTCHHANYLVGGCWPVAVKEGGR